MPKVSDPSALGLGGGPRGAPSAAAPAGGNDIERQWGPGARLMPDGSIVRYGPRGGATVLRKATGGEGLALTEDQGKAQTYARLMREAEIRYMDAVREGYDPNVGLNPVASFFEGLPKGVGEGIGSYLRNDVADKARQAELLYTDPQLKAMTGAASSAGEETKYPRTYFVQPGQKMSVIGPQARAARETAFKAAMTRSGPAGPQIGRFPTDIPKNAPGGSIETAIDLSKGQSRTTIPAFAYYRDPQGNIRRNENDDRGNPIVKKATGAQTSTKAYSDAEKERRYQAWKKANGYE